MQQERKARIDIPSSRLVQSKALGRAMGTVPALGWAQEPSDPTNYLGNTFFLPLSPCFMGVCTPSCGSRLGQRGQIPLLPGGRGQTWAVHPEFIPAPEYPQELQRSAPGGDWDVLGEPAVLSRHC